MLGRGLCAWIVLALAAGCGGDERALPADAPRLVVLYATCTLNKGFLGPYAGGPAAAYGIQGLERVRFTPSLDRLAREGVVFERHQSESAQSGIAFASLFTGTQADVHGIYYHPTRLPDELLTITEAFAEAGYEPWFWNGHEMASSELNYGQGVSEEHLSRTEGRAKRAQKLAFLQPEDPQFQRLLARLAEDPEYRAFVLVNFTVTHGGYDRQLPAPAYDAFLAEFPEVARGATRAGLAPWWKVYGENRLALQWDFPRTVERLGLSGDHVAELARALEITYAADVGYLDGMVGRTLDELERAGLADATLFAFTADHGEVLHRPNALYHWTHDLELAPEELAVPWIVRGKGLAPRRFAGVTSSIDVFPTLAGLAGFDVAGRGPVGRDLSREIRGGTEPAPEIAWSHTTSIGPESVEQFQGWELAGRFFGSTDVGLIWASARDGDRVFKLRNLDGERWGVQLFDLAADPWEERDLFDAANQEHAEMARRLEAYKARLVERFGARSTERPENALDILQSTGYVGGAPPPPPPAGTKPGP
jgi:arylsulfatase A-like enzyme